MNDKLLGMLGLAVRAGKVSFGVFMTEKLVDEGKARLVIAASDIGASNKRRLEAKCSHAGVRIIYYSDAATSHIRPLSCRRQTAACNIR